MEKVSDRRNAMSTEKVEKTEKAEKTKKVEKTDAIWPQTEKSLLQEASSLGELMEGLRGRMSPILIGDREWAQTLECARNLPATMAAFPFGFELPLHKTQPTADFGVSIFGGSQSAAFFEKMGESEDSDPTSTGIAQLLAQIETEDSPLGRIVGRKMMLEYDQDVEESTQPQMPGLFIYPIEGVLIGNSQQQLKDLNITIDAIASATGLDLNADNRCRQIVKEMYLAMEPDTNLRTVGSFPSRGKGLRLSMTGFKSAGSLMSFLKRTGWPGSHEIVESTVARFEKRKAFEHLEVLFDIRAEGLGPKLGLSFYANKKQWSKNINYWKPLIEGIREDRLAVEEKLSALTHSCCGSEVLFGKSNPLLLVRGVHHIKFTVNDNRIEQVKAYIFQLMMNTQILV